MNLAMKTNSITKKNVHHMNIEGWEERNIICKKHSYTFKYLKYIFKLSKIKGLIQVLASTLEKHNYMNLTFETNSNNT
jgi:hypothetical protein